MGKYSLAKGLTWANPGGPIHFMGIIDRLTGRTERLLTEQLRQLADNEELLREGLAELELAIDAQGWQRIASEFDREFSRSGLRDIMKFSRLMFLKNPLVNRAVTLQAIYVWAQGVQITSTDEDVQAVVDAFLQDARNQAELTAHQARTMKEQDLQVLGNLFFAMFTSVSDGATVVRTLPPEEIDEIICNPEDGKDPWFYKRTWTAQVMDFAAGISRPNQQTAYYPDIRYSNEERPATIGGKPVMWDSPVYHVRVGGLSDMQFGVPETYQSIDWARAYNQFLENWATIVAAYARFAFKLTSKGGKAGIAAAKTRLGTTYGSGGSGETNPPPVTGATFIAGEGTDIAPVKTSGATTSADDARRLLLMVCAGFGMPESFFGDVSVGTLATAKSLDRPTELKFRDRQELWKGILDTILQYAIARSQSAANGRLRLVGKVERAPLEIHFPPILEHDVTEQVNAIVAGATLNGSALAGTMDRETLSKLVLNALGVSNVQEVIDLLKAQWEEEDAQADDAQTAPPVDPDVAEAVRGLREAIDALRSKVAA